MMKRKIVLSIILVMVLLLALTGCNTGSNSKIGKDYAEEYYDAFSDQDYEECASMFHESLVEDVGGEDTLFEIYDNMEIAWGKLTDYEVKQTGFYSSGGETDVDLEIDVTYSTGMTATDAMTVWVLKDGTAYITMISTGDPQ
ncbi:MAG: nuclear transport factor 2 family protein [Eubacteriales bacterium]